MHYFAVIIHPTNQTKTKGYAKHYPDMGVFKIGPEQCADKYCHQYKRTTHGGCARFAEMTLRSVTANCLPHLQIIE